MIKIQDVRPDAPYMRESMPDLPAARWSFTWTDFGGGVHNSLSRWYREGEHFDGWFQALKQARALGWTPPRWWQWWRWNDQPRTAAMPAEVAKWLKEQEEWRKTATPNPTGVMEEK